MMNPNPGIAGVYRAEVSTVDVALQPAIPIPFACAAAVAASYVRVWCVRVCVRACVRV
jgi:hypothetical protein